MTNLDQTSSNFGLKKT